MGLPRLLKGADVPESLVQLAPRYHQEFPGEVDRLIAEYARPEEEWHRRFPSVVPPVAARTRGLS